MNCRNLILSLLLMAAVAPLNAGVTVLEVHYFGPFNDGNEACLEVCYTADITDFEFEFVLGTGAEYGNAFQNTLVKAGLATIDTFKDGDINVVVVEYSGLQQCNGVATMACTVRDADGNEESDFIDLVP